MGLTLLKQWGTGALITISSLFFKAWFKSCRLKILQDELHKEFFLESRQCIGVTWHRAAIFYCYFFGRFHPMAMFSQSQDGEYLSRFAQKCGVIPVRGSSTRGGQKALIQMIRSLKEGVQMCSTVLDGPQGPPFKAKKGLLLLAQKTGVPLLPSIWSARRTITLEKTWDKTMIPWPFSKVFIAYGSPMVVPEECSETEMEQLRLELENRLNTIMMEADQACGYKTRWE
jgi:lysophospholipid acyltransferase (LPLAT)-like uncharacterized protein